MYNYIPLRFVNKEVKVGSATWSLYAALRKALATNSNTAKKKKKKIEKIEKIEKNPQTDLSAKTTDRQEKIMIIIIITTTTIIIIMQGHI